MKTVHSSNPTSNMTCCSNSWDGKSQLYNHGWNAKRHTKVCPKRTVKKFSKIMKIDIVMFRMKQNALRTVPCVRPAW